MKKRDFSLILTDSDNETRVVLIFQAVLELILGAFLVIYPDRTGSILFIVIGAIMTGYGLFDIIAFVTNNRSYSFRQGLMTGVLITIIGVAFIVQAEALSNLLTIILGAFIIIESIVNARRSVLIKELGFSQWIIPLIISVIGIGIGIVISIFPDLFQTVVFTIIGIVLILESALDIWAIHRITKLKNKLKSKMEDESNTIIVRD